MYLRGSRGVVKIDNELSNLDDFELNSFESKVNELLFISPMD